MKCSYGCGQIAIVQFKSGKYCCGKSTSSCPEMKRQNSAKVKKLREGKGNTFWKNGHPKGSKNGTSLKGKTYEDIYGTEEALKRKRLLSEKQKGKNTWASISHEKQEEIRQACSDRIIARYESGWMPKAGRCKKYTYVSPNAGTVSLDGSWELMAAQWFDMKQFNWKRNTKRFAYINLKGKRSHYTPDFYVEGIGYIEVKGYKTKLDECKWDQFPEKLTVWFKDTIETIKEDLEGWQSGNAVDC